MKKKRDKIDGLFRDYFAGGSEQRKMMLSAKINEVQDVCYDLVHELPAARTKCPDTAKLGAYIDGSLNKKEAGVLEGHIPGCRKCRDKVREAKSAVERFEKGDLPEAPQAVSSEELSRLTKKNPRKK